MTVYYYDYPDSWTIAYKKTVQIYFNLSPKRFEVPYIFYWLFLIIMINRFLSGYLQ